MDFRVSQKQETQLDGETISQQRGGEGKGRKGKGRKPSEQTKLARGRGGGGHGAHAKHVYAKVDRMRGNWIESRENGEEGRNKNDHKHANMSQTGSATTARRG